MTNRERLRAAMESRRANVPVTAADLARHLGVTPQSVGQWLAGTTRPRRKHAEEIERLYGVPADGWRAVVAAGKVVAK